jgi:hypothetical protein
MGTDEQRTTCNEGRDVIFGVHPFLDSLLPRGGYVVSFASVYIDESGSHKGSPIFCLAGFLFEKEHADVLETEWSAILARENMPYMRMSQFTKPGQEPFGHLGEQQRKVIEIELVDLIRRHRKFAFISAVNETEYDHAFKTLVMDRRNWPPTQRPVSAYSWCLTDCLMMIRSWADETSFDGEIAYLFESGHGSQGEANYGMNYTFSDPIAKKMARLGTYRFGGKEDIAPLQTADMLAWLAANWLKRGVASKDMRKDLKQLLDCSGGSHQTFSIHYWSRQYLEQTFEMEFKKLTENISFSWRLETQENR